MSVALLVITDGRRDCVAQTIPSARANLVGPVTRKVIYDDSGDEGHHDWLADTFPDFELFAHPMGRQGFGGAIRTAWSYLAAGDEDHVFHLEDDFVFNRTVRLDDMALVLDNYPYLIQLALRRQPWNEEERAAGGIVESHPDDFAEMTWNGHTWLEHRRFFTTNPCLYRRSLCTEQWPDGEHSEGRFGQRLIERPSARFGYWGARASGEWVAHVGHERVGVGY